MKKEVTLVVASMLLSMSSIAQNNQNAISNQSNINAPATARLTQPIIKPIVQFPEHVKFQKVLKNDEMLQILKNKYPKLGIINVYLLPEINLYEVETTLSASLAYTNKEMSFFFLNNEFVDPEKGTIVTKERNHKQIANVVKRASEEKDQIRTVYGDPNAPVRRNILIFSDPECPYCKDFDKELYQNFRGENLTITYYMNPLQEIHPTAPELAAKLWCSDNKSKAWEDWMLVGTMPNNPGTCANPTVAQAKLARTFNLLITPSIFFDNGYVFRGQPKLDEFKEILNKPGVLADK